MGRDYSFFMLLDMCSDLGLVSKQWCCVDRKIKSSEFALLETLRAYLHNNKGNWLFA